MTPLPNPITLIHSVPRVIALVALILRENSKLAESLIRTDRYCRRVASGAVLALLVAALFATLCSKTYASCSEFDRKFMIGPLTGGPHAASPAGLADGEQPLLVRNLIPGETIRVISLMLAADRRVFSTVQMFRVTDSELNTAKGCADRRLVCRG